VTRVFSFADKVVLITASKGGVNDLTKAAAIEAGKDRISVNALAFAASTSPGA
jgi:NAD(P)-dependent dehydrogenase (short-subunit alcohol dehydrogenase family)